MNSDTFAGLSGVLTGNPTYRNNLLPLTGLGTTETVVNMATDSSLTTGVAAFVRAPLQTDIIGSNAPLDQNENGSSMGGNLGRPGQDYRGARPYFNSNSFNGRPFCLQASGYFTTSAVDSATAHAINLYQATAANGAQLTTKNTIFSALSSATLAAGSYNYLIQVNLVWDAVSHLLNGWAEATVGGTYTVRTALTPITIASPTDLFFFQSVKFNTGAANTITPVELNLSQF
jgi:hypothetical protein